MEKDRQQPPADSIPLRFDEGERKPSPITATGDDNVRAALPTSPASTESITDEDEQARHAQATIAPGQGRDPKRHTM